MFKSQNKLIVLSGGEPFEHPEIDIILMNLKKQTTPFRIATGGFIDLSFWITQLKELCFPDGYLQGISIGTDVISPRITHSKWVPIWENNIHLLSKFKIPFSLTFSIDSEFDFTKLNLWNWIINFNSYPEFIYLRYSDKDLCNDWIKKIQSSFGRTPIIEDYTDINNNN